jgi:hypothetical protein
VSVQAIWHGTVVESCQLTTAINNNCPHKGLGCRGCDAHAAMLDQRFIDGVLWARWLLPRLKREEWRRRGSKMLR